MHPHISIPGRIPGTIRIAIAVILLFAVTCTAPLSAHPPSSIDLRYDTLNQQLNVTIIHPVADPSTHFIRQVTIRTGGETCTYPYSSQPARESITYLYTLPLETPGPVEVTASCNIGGDLTRTLYNTRTVPATAGSTPPSFPVPGPASLYPLLWPFHALFMVTSVILLFAAILMVTYWKKRSGWYRFHRLLAATGAVLAIIGLTIAWYMVSITGGPNFRVFHGIFGAITLTLVFLTLLLGVVRNRVRRHKVTIRTIHMWAGRLVFVLLVLTILLGIRQAGILP